MFAVSTQGQFPGTDYKVFVGKAQEWGQPLGLSDSQVEGWAKSVKRSSVSGVVWLGSGLLWPGSK